MMLHGECHRPAFAAGSATTRPYAVATSPRPGYRPTRPAAAF